MSFFERAFQFCFPALLISLAAFFIGPAFAHSVMGEKAINSYTIQLYGTSLAGSRITYSREITARRSDGSRVEIHESPVSESAVEWVAHRTITFANGVVVEIRTDTRAKTTVNHNPNSPEWINHNLDAIDPASGCSKNFHAKPWSAAAVIDEGHEIVRGYDTIRFRLTDPNGDIVTQWRSPAFGCEVLQEDEVMRNGTVEHKIPILLELGEPEPTYFELPPGYKELGSKASSGHVKSRPRSVSAFATPAH